MKHPYMKEILKTILKVTLIAGLTAVATPYIFGFAAGLLNSMLAGYMAGTITCGFGTWTAIKTFAKDIMTIHNHVKRRKQEERIKEQLQDIREELKEIKSKEKRTGTKTKSKEERIQPEIDLEQQKAIKQSRKAKFILWKRFKKYDRAA